MGTINLEVGDEERLTVDPSGEVIVTGTWAKTGNAVVITAVSYTDRSCVIRAINTGQSKVTWNGYMMGSKCDFYWIVNVKSGPNTAPNNPSLNATDVLLKIGEEFELVATYSGDDIGWGYNNNDGVISSVRLSSQQDGVQKLKVTGVGEGTASISASLIDKTNGVVSIVPNSKITCNFTVKGYAEDYRFTQRTSEGITITYRLVDADEKTCQVYSVSMYEEGTCTIPSYANGFKVVAIGDSVFAYCQFTKVIIPNTVTSIGKRAFYMSELESVTFGEGLVSIGDEAFYGTNLSKVNFPSTLTKIGDRAFHCCFNLETVTGVNQLEYIGADAFNSTPMYEKLPSGLLYIGKVLYKFKSNGYDGAKLAINVREGTKMISGKAFSELLFFRDTIDISIPSSTTFIQCEANDYFDFLKWGLMCSPNSITVAPDNPVYDSRNNCNALMHTATNTLLAASRQTTIPENTQIIGGGAFSAYCYGHSDMKINMVIPNSVDSIGEMAFYGADAIDTVMIGSGVNGIGEALFYGCNDLSAIIVSPQNKTYDSRGDCNAIIDKRANKLIAGCKTTVIPSTVNSLGNYAYSTGGYGSYGGNEIWSIVIPDNVEEIGDHAFYNINGIKVLTLGKGVRKMGRELLSSYPENMSLCMLNEMPPAVITNYQHPTFTNSAYEKLTLYVPEGALASYMMADGWSAFKNIKEGNAPIPVQKVIIDKANNYDSWSNYPNVEVGKTMQLTATVLPENASNKAVVWKSQNEDIATISADGVVSGIKTGKVSIWCTSADDSSISDYITIGVYEIVKPTAITLPETANVVVGKTTMLTPQLTPVNATTTLTWTSDDEDIATVDSNGEVTGVKKGMTFITVVTDNGLEAFCELTVTEVVAPEPTKIEIPSKLSLNVGQELKVDYILTPENAETAVTWNTNKEGIVRINSEGILEGLTEGLVVLTATTANGITSNSCRVTVKMPNADVNADGSTDVADISTVLSVMAGDGANDVVARADVNGDGTVDVADISTILSIMSELARLQREMTE